MVLGGGGEVEVKRPKWMHINLDAGNGRKLPHPEAGGSKCGGFKSPDWGHQIEAETTNGPSGTAGVLREMQLLFPQKVPKVDRQLEEILWFLFSLPPFLQ